MLKKLHYKLASLVTMAAMMLAPVVFASSASATADISNNVCGGVNSLSISDTSGSCSDDSDSAGKLDNLIQNIVNLFSIVVGIIAVIMIIVGGFRYITSGGDSNKVGSAKTTIIYAIVGLVIVALAQFIVKFVLSKATGATS